MSKSSEPSPLDASGGHERWRVVVECLVLGIVYGVVARVGLAYSSIAPNVTLIWAPTGISLFAALRWGPRLWPGIVLGDLIANAGTGAPWLSVLGISAGNVAQTLACCWALRRIGFDDRLQRVRDVVALLALGTLGAALSACIGPVSLTIGESIGWSAFPSVWLQWLMGDATGVVVLTPFLLAWRTPPTSRLTAPQWAEAAMLLAALAVLCMTIFGTVFDGPISSAPGYYPAALALFPLAVWASLRFGLRGATLLTLLVSVAAVWGTVRGVGPFVDGAQTSSLLRWWVFANVITITSLLLASSQSERDHARAEAIRDRDFSSAILDAEGALVVVLDAAWNIRRVNRAFESVTGFAQADIAGRAFVDALIPAEQQDKVRAQAEILRLDVGSTSSSRHDSTLRRRRGPPITVTWASSVLRGPDGHVSHVIVSGVDVSARVEAAEALRHARRQLESRVAERTRDLEVANGDLQIQMAERLRLEQSLMQISEREQERIGQELHDGLGQHLTATAIQAELLARDLASAGADEARMSALRIESMLSEAVSQTRLLARGLFPVEIEVNGLMAALELLAETTQRLSRQRCTLRCPLPVDIADHEVAIHLYRIAQEALNNATKHAPGADIEMVLQHRNGQIELAVSNGIGKAPARLNDSAGIGLRIMRHRAEMIAARLEVGTAEGRWCVSVRLVDEADSLPGCDAEARRGAA